MQRQLGWRRQALRSKPQSSELCHVRCVLGKSGPREVRTRISLEVSAFCPSFRLGMSKMNNMDSRLRLQDRNSLSHVWYMKYCRRRDKKAYDNECVGLEASLEAGESLTTKFLRKGRTRLHPPDRSLFLTLRKFLGTTNLDHLHSNSGFIILDDRWDPNGDADTIRVWDSDTYRLRPPPGRDIRTEKLSLLQFLDLLRQKVSIGFSTSHDVE